MKLILLRHGQTVFNQMDYNQGWFDSPLTPLGIEQAKKARVNLQKYKIDVCYSSPSERAVDTADLALNYSLKINRDKRLKEMYFGVFEGNPNCIGRGVNQSMPNMDDHFDLFGGESSKTVIDREMNFIHEIEKKYTDETILIAGHGCSLKLLLLELGKDSINEVVPGWTWFGNAEAAVLEKTDTGYKVIDYLANK